MLINADQCDPGGEDKIILFEVVAPVHVDEVLRRSCARRCFLDHKFEDGSLPDTFLELDPVHGDGDKIAARIFHGGGDESIFVDPFEQMAAEEKTVVIQVFGQDQLVIFHASYLVLSVSENDVEDGLEFARLNGLQFNGQRVRWFENGISSFPGLWMVPEIDLTGEAGYAVVSRP